MNPASERNSHSSHSQRSYTVDSSEINPEIIESVDDYSPDNLFESSKQEDENSLHGGEMMLMPTVRNRSASNSDAFPDIDSQMMFQHQNSTNGGTQKKMITSTHTPAANIIMNFGDRLRTNFRSLVNRRENVYTSHESNNYPLQSRSKRASNANPDTFSSLSTDFMQASKICDSYEVYDGNQPYTPKSQANCSKNSINRSPSVGPNSTSNNKSFRIRSSSEVRNRRNTYEEK